MAVCPCKDCKERFVTCHISCEKYKEWKKPLEEFKENRVKQKKIDDVLFIRHARKIRIKDSYKRRSNDVY
jgi:hypothetical protein